MSDDRVKTINTVEGYLRLGLPMGMSVMPDSVVCRICGGQLDPHQKVTTQVCGMSNCQARMHQQRIEIAAHNLEVREEGRDGERPLAYRRAGPVAVAAAKRIGVEDLSAVAAAVVPFSVNPLEPLPPERRAAFEAHLEETVAKAFEPEYDAHLADPEAHFSKRADIEPSDPFPVSACCIACQGYCCLIGNGTHAFIGSLLIAYYRHRNPGVTPEEVRAAYLARLPEVSTKDGCVYQGPRGCTLPREMRADICNSYRCSGQEHMQSALRSHAAAAEAAADEAKMMAMMAGQEPPPAASVAPPNVAIVALATWHWESTDPEEPLHRALTITPEGELTIHEDIPLPPLPSREKSR